MQHWRSYSLCSIHEVLVCMDSVSCDSHAGVAAQGRGVGSITNGCLLWKHTSKKGKGRWAFSVAAMVCFLHICVIVPGITRWRENINISCLSHDQAAASLRSEELSFRQGPFKTWWWCWVSKGSTSCFLGHQHVNMCIMTPWTANVEQR